MRNNDILVNIIVTYYYSDYLMINYYSDNLEKNKYRKILLTKKNITHKKINIKITFTHTIFSKDMLTCRGLTFLTMEQTLVATPKLSRTITFRCTKK